MHEVGASEPGAAVAEAKQRSLSGIKESSFNGSPDSPVTSTLTAATQEKLQYLLSALGHGIGASLYALILFCILNIGFCALLIDFILKKKTKARKKESNKGSNIASSCSRGPETVFDEGCS